MTGPDRLDRTTVTKPDVSVVIVTYNSEQVVGPCLQSLRRADGVGRLQLILVDNASSDRTVEAARRTAPDATIIVNTSNRGLAAANNQGLRAAREDLILICNPDVVFHPGAVASMADLMSRKPEAAWVVPRLLYEDGSVQTSAGDLPTLPEALLGRQVARRRSDGCSGFWWDDWAHDEERQIGRGHEAAYLLRRRAIDDVGLQDERYFLDWEGLDWTDRLRRASWQVWIAPSAEVVHRGGDSIRKTPGRWVRYQHRAMYLYFSERRPRYWRPMLALIIGLRAGIKICAIRAGLPLYLWAHRDRRGTATAHAVERNPGPGDGIPPDGS